MHYTLLCNKTILLHASSHTSNKQFLQNPHHQGSLLAALPFPAQGQTSAYRRDATPPPQLEPPYFNLFSHPPLAVSPSPPRSRLSAPSYFFLLQSSSSSAPPPRARRAPLDRRLPTVPPHLPPLHLTLSLSLSLARATKSPARSSPRCVAAAVPAPKSEATERAAVPSAQAKQATSGSPPPRPPPPALPRRSTWTFFVLSVSRRPLTCLDSVRSDLLCFFSMVLREKSNPTDAPST
jgi:hypothetical protein